MKDFIVIVVLPLGSFVGSLLFVANLFMAYQCENYQTITGKETKYAQLDSCYVKTPQGWQRYDEYKMRIIASEGK